MPSEISNEELSFAVCRTQDQFELLDMISESVFSMIEERDSDEEMKTSIM